MSGSVDGETMSVGPPADLTPSSMPDRAVGQAPQPGDTVGRYVVLSALGSGGMGVVVVAHDPELDRRVALKLLRPDAAGSSGGSGGPGRLLREARAMATLSHPNVIGVYDVGTVGESVFIAMELVEGRSLRQWLDAGPHPWRAVLEVFVAAGHGLAAAHAAGIVHRDFKPDNVLIGDDGRVRVLDFGLAHPTSRGTTADQRPVADASGSITAPGLGILTRDGVVMGTPVYMSPEQHLGRETDARSDQFSFCVALFSALFGVRPFTGTSPDDLAEAKIRGELQSVPARRRVPGHVRRAVIRGLASRPSDRYPSMPTLLDALTRRRSALTLGAFGSLGVATFAVLGSWGTGQPSQCRAEAAWLDGVWDDGRSGAVQAAILGTGVAYADDTWTRVEAGLHDYRGRWTAMRVEACEQGAAGADDLVDRRLACLQRHRSQLQAVVDVLAEADDAVVRKSVGMVMGLPDLQQCSDPKLLRGRPAAPDDPDRIAVRDQIARARALEKAGRYDPATEVANQATTRAQAVGDPLLVAEARLELGTLQSLRGNAEQAEQTLAESVWAASAAGDDDLAALGAGQLVHLVGYKQGRHDEALDWGRHAEAFVRRAGGSAQRRAYVLNSIGNVMGQAGRLDEAVDTLLESRSLWAEARGVDSLEVATSHNNLGIIRFNQGRYDVALDEYRRALAIRRDKLGPTHPNVGVTLNNIGNALYEQAMYEEAMDHHHQAMEIWKTGLGPEHPYIAASLTNQGNAAYSLRRYEDATRLYGEAIALRERNLGPKHPDLAMTVNNLGSILEVQGRSAEALVQLRRALAIYEEVYGEDHAQVAATVSNIGSVLFGMEKYDESLASHRRALRIRRQVNGDDHPEVGRSLTNVGGSLAALGRPEDGARYHRRALAVFSATFGPDHPDVTLAHHNIGDVLLTLDRPAEALEHLELALRGRTQTESDPVDLAETRFALARALWHQGQDRTRALELAGQAQTALAADGQRSEAAVAQIRQWLARRRQG